ncbi:hypothetical protein METBISCDRAFT_9190, partial [Metschnikowia bicuspidata]
ASRSAAPSASHNDFVRKLYQMLLEEKYTDVVRWTSAGHSFVVLNTNDFTKHILPTHFKHSNFASFVRQLNKYDFHKVKIPTEEKQVYQYGDNAWEFEHRDFKRDDTDALENIRRKPPVRKENPAEMNGQLNSQIQLLQYELARVQRELKATTDSYRMLFDSVVVCRTFNERFYHAMGTLINCLTQAGFKLPPMDIPNTEMLGMMTPGLLPGPAPPSRPASISGPSTLPVDTCSVDGIAPDAGSIHGLPSRPVNSRLHMAPAHQLASEAPATIAGGQMTDSLDHLIPPMPPNGIYDAISSTNLPDPKFHVLLVEDDDVYIQLCRKHLIKYGCKVTVVTDGLLAISTVKQTKYDFVLMDIVMPNLDGASAANFIRKFDENTPIVAMTSNFEEKDLESYLNHGMNDILAKPFTTDDLYLMLSKHLL